MPTADPSDVARRCSTCGISWPRSFIKCYQCGGHTDLCRGDGPSLTMEEANSMKNHYEFERFLERRAQS